MRKATLLGGMALLALAGCLGPRTDAAPPAPKVRMGYSREHPLPMASIPASYAFLDRLRTPEGHPVRYRRVGSALTPARGEGHGGKGILDLYEVTDDTGAAVRLWLDPYAGRTSETPPDGFRLAPPTAP